MRINKKIIPLLFLLLAPGINIFAQDLTANFRRHIETLADDKFEGRETGTEGERKSREYIAAEFKAIGLIPKGDNGSFFQVFDFTSGRKYEEGNKLLIGKKELGIGSEWFPLPIGGNGNVTGKPFDAGFGISAPDLGQDDYAGKNNIAGKIFIIALSSPDGLHPHSKFIDHNDLRTKISVAEKFGASAVIIINNDPDAESPVENLRKKEVRESIPVVFISGVSKAILLKSKISISVHTSDIKTEGRNVIGQINNDAKLTIIIGAHYDHLGFGTENSLYRGAPAIHNGADDNASGVSMIIELARKIKTEGSRNFNYLIIAFSGEELGLFGSKFYVDHPVGSLSQVAYMLNFDMVGRMDSDDYKLAINGTGTSPTWAVLDSLNTGSIKIKKSSAGIGPSDQTSFYLKDIPVLHFFSGTHEDYHKPSDDFDKINYKGMNDIFAIVLDLMNRMENRGKLGFTTTKNEEGAETPKFKVTLGVIPDYMYDGEGMRIDGVTDGKPASKAGLVKGDIVIKLGDIEVKDMMSYMKGLSKFEKGDKAIVKFKRGEEMKEAEVTF